MLEIITISFGVMIAVTCQFISSITTILYGDIYFPSSSIFYMLLYPVFFILSYHKGYKVIIYTTIILALAQFFACTIAFISYEFMNSHNVHSNVLHIASNEIIWSVIALVAGKAVNDLATYFIITKNTHASSISILVKIVIITSISEFIMLFTDYFHTFSDKSFHEVISLIFGSWLIKMIFLPIISIISWIALIMIDKYNEKIESKL